MEPQVFSSHGHELVVERGHVWMLERSSVVGKDDKVAVGFAVKCKRM